MAGSSALSLTHVTVTYSDGYEAVHDVSVEVEPGEILALLGASGSGKSSMLRGIAGLEEVTTGHVLIQGEDTAGIPVHRRGCGMVFQSPQLFPHRTVGQNVAYGIERSGRSRAAVHQEVAQWLELVGLAGFAGRAVTTLSGGQAQRVALARSLAPRPRIMLLDEPLSALDRRLREELSVELRRILTQAGTAAVYVTHDHDEAFTVADRVAIMRDGRVVQVGTMSDLYGHPVPEAEGFLRAIPTVRAIVVRKVPGGGVRVVLDRSEVDLPDARGEVGDEVVVALKEHGSSH